MIIFFILILGLAAAIVTGLYYSSFLIGIFSFFFGETLLTIIAMLMISYFNPLPSLKKIDEYQVISYTKDELTFMCHDGKPFTIRFNNPRVSIFPQFYVEKHKEKVVVRTYTYGALSFWCPNLYPQFSLYNVYISKEP